MHAWHFQYSQVMTSTLTIRFVKSFGQCPWGSFSEIEGNEQTTTLRSFASTTQLIDIIIVLKHEYLRYPFFATSHPS